MRRVLIDTNVAVDFFLKRETFGDKVKSIPLQIMFVLLLAVLTSGCVPKRSESWETFSSSPGFDFNVEGVAYSCLGIWTEAFTTSEKKDVYRAAVFIVYPESEERKYSPGLESYLDKRKSTAYIEIAEQRKNIPASLNSVIYIDDFKIVFDKSFKELGIDNADRKAFSEENLKPALEKLIRENVTPKETETKK